MFARIKSGNRALAPLLMVINGLSLYAGAAIAVGLFEDLPPVLVAWLRISTAAVILSLIHI